MHLSDVACPLTLDAWLACISMIFLLRTYLGLRTTLYVLCILLGFLSMLVQQLLEIACALVTHHVMHAMTPLSRLLPVNHDQHALQACARLSIPMHQVDAHNVVPVWVASDKKETAARTIRKKIHSKLPIFLTVSQSH